MSRIPWLQPLIPHPARASRESHAGRHAITNTSNATGRYNRVKKNNRRAESRPPPKANFSASAIIRNASSGPATDHTTFANPRNAGISENTASTNENPAAIIPLRRPLTSPFDHIR